jgi:hypothetical protein
MEIGNTAHNACLLQFRESLQPTVYVKGQLSTLVNARHKFNPRSLNW